MLMSGFLSDKLKIVSRSLNRMLVYFKILASGMRIYDSSKGHHATRHEAAEYPFLPLLIWQQTVHSTLAASAQNRSVSGFVNGLLDYLLFRSFLSDPFKNLKICEICLCMHEHCLQTIYTNLLTFFVNGKIMKI